MTNGQDYAYRIQQAHVDMMENFIEPGPIYMSQDVMDSIIGNRYHGKMNAFITSAGQFPVVIVENTHDFLYMATEHYDRVLVDEAFEKEFFCEDIVYG